MSAQAPEGSAPSARHLVAAAEAGDGARFAALLAPTFAPVRVRPLVDGTFHSSLRSAAAGDVRVSVVSGSPCVVTRDADLIDPTDPAFLSVTLQRAGRAAVAQDGRHCLLGPGDLVNYVTSRPYEVTFWEPYEAVVVTVPLTALGAHVDTLAGRTAIAVGTDCGPRDVVGALFASLAAKVDSCTLGDSEPQQGVPRGRDRLAGHRGARRRRTAGRGRRPRGPGPRPLPLAPVRSGAHRRLGGAGPRHIRAVPAQGARPDGQLAVGLDPQAAARADLPRPRRRVAARAHRRRHRVAVGHGRRRAPEPGVEGGVRHDRERDPPVQRWERGGPRRLPDRLGAVEPRATG